jgi:chitodextrinase
MGPRPPPLGRRVRLTLLMGAGVSVLVVTLGLDSANPIQASGSTDPVIAAAGDIACDPTSSSFNGGLGTSGSCHAMKTSNMLVNGGFAAVLPLGDNQYYCGGYQGFMQSYDASWGRVKPISYPAVGNHEYLTSGGTGCDPTGKGLGYFQYFGSAAGNPSQGYYSYNVGTWHLIALNSNCGSAGGCSASSAQGKWLVADLAAHQNVCTLAYWHIPLYSSGGRANGNSKYFWQALYAAHADVILSSHDHTYERFAPQDPYGHLDAASGIREFIVGTGGANHTSFTTVFANSEVRDSTSFGIMEMTLHPTGYDWNFVPDSGGTFTDAGSGTCHSSGGDTVPPTTPTNVAASAVSPGEVDLSWTASTDNFGVAGYRIYRNGAVVGFSATTAYADTSVQPSTTYSYYTIAYDAGGNTSTASNTVGVTTPATPDTVPPSPPSGVTATAHSPTEVDLTWTASTDNVGVAGYRIYRDGVLVASSATTTYADTGVQPSTSYSYYTIAYDAAGNTSTASNTVSVTSGAPDATPPSPPSGLVANVASATEVDLGWTASTDNVGVAGYRIYRNGTLVGTSATNAYADRGVQPATNYSYYTIAYDAAGNSSTASNTASATTPATPDTTSPSTPSGVAAVAPSSTEVDVSWTASTDNVGVAGYRIYRNGALVGSSATNAYADTGVQPATSYSYYTIAYDAAGNSSAASNTATITTPPPDAGPPDIFSDGFESANLSAWTAATNMVVQTATVHGGSKAVESNVTNAAANFHKTLPSTYGTIYVRVWFRIHTSSTNVSLLSPRTSSNSALLHLYRDFSTGKLGLRNDVTLTNRPLASPISLDTWHSLEIKVVVSPTGGVTQVWLDGVDQTPLDSTTDNLGSTNVGDVLIGDSSSARTFDAFWDDAAVSHVWISG